MDFNSSLVSTGWNVTAELQPCWQGLGKVMADLIKHHLEGLDGLQAKSFAVLYSLVFQWTSQAISQALLLIWGKRRKFPSAVSFETLYMVREERDYRNLHALLLCEQKSISWAITIKVRGCKGQCHSVLALVLHFPVFRLLLATSEDRMLDWDWFFWPIFWLFLTGLLKTCLEISLETFCVIKEHSNQMCQTNCILDTKFIPCWHQEPEFW